MHTEQVNRATNPRLPSALPAGDVAPLSTGVPATGVWNECRSFVLSEGLRIGLSSRPPLGPLPRAAAECSDGAPREDRRRPRERDVATDEEHPPLAWAAEEPPPFAAPFAAPFATLFATLLVTLLATLLVTLLVALFAAP
jgi:hypothetical protein